MVLRNHATLLLFKVFLRLSELTGVADRRYYHHLFCLSLFLPSSCLSVLSHRQFCESFLFISFVSCILSYFSSFCLYLFQHLVCESLVSRLHCFSPLSRILCLPYLFFLIYSVSPFFFHLVYLFFLFNSPGRSPEELMHYPRRWRRRQRPHLR